MTDPTNPLYEGWRTRTLPISPENQARIREYEATYQAMFPDSLDPNPGDFLRDQYMRDTAIAQYSFAIPSPEALALLARGGPIVEMGAGLGYWAHVLHKTHGVGVAAYDAYPVGSGKNEYWKDPHQEPWYEVWPGTPEGLSEYKNSALLLVWPPYDDPMAAECLKHYTGQHVIYVGEGPGGCTGDDEFHAALEYDWTKIQTVRIPRWRGINDYLAVYRRGPSPKQSVPKRCECDGWSRAPCLKCWRDGLRTKEPDE